MHYSQKFFCGEKAVPTIYIFTYIFATIIVMEHKIVFPPVPDERSERYEWIDSIVDQGMKIGIACEMASVPRITYYKYTKRIVTNRDLGDETEDVA